MLRTGWNGCYGIPLKEANDTFWIATAQVWGLVRFIYRSLFMIFVPVRCGSQVARNPLRLPVLKKNYLYSLMILTGILHFILLRTSEFSFHSLLTFFLLSN
jgi:hypothetical protein